MNISVHSSKPRFFKLWEDGYWYSFICLAAGAVAAIRPERSLVFFQVVLILTLLGGGILTFLLHKHLIAERPLSHTLAKGACQLLAVAMLFLPSNKIMSALPLLMSLIPMVLYSLRFEIAIVSKKAEFRLWYLNLIASVFYLALCAFFMLSNSGILELTRYAGLTLLVEGAFDIPMRMALAKLK